MDGEDVVEGLRMHMIRAYPPEMDASEETLRNDAKILESLAQIKGILRRQNWNPKY